METPKKRGRKAQSDYETETYRAVASRFGVNLRRLREEKAWTQEEAGGACGMSMQQYQQVESGKANPTLVTLVRLADAYGVDVVALLE